MRKPRIKCPGQEMAYHCTSRMVDGLPFWTDFEKQHMVGLIRRVGEFCGLETLVDTVMGNHYHLLIVVPAQQQADNAELLRRYEVLYGKCAGRARQIRRAFEQGGGPAQYWREWLLRRMGDISEHQRLVKEYFSKWYNRRHKRRGALWSGRFEGPVVEVERESLERVAAYILLNPLRAGLVKDPSDYRFSSYHAALAGHAQSQKGLRRVTGTADISEALVRIRLVMAIEGVKVSKDPKKLQMDAKLQREILSRGGKLSLASTIYWRNRYFVDGVVIGTQEYVEQMAKRLGQAAGKRQRRGEPMKGCGEEDSLRVLGRLRQAVYGFE